jgi:hypothetical protein
MIHEIPTRFTFQGVFKVAGAQSKEQAEELVRKHCGFCAGGEFHSYGFEQKAPERTENYNDFAFKRPAQLSVLRVPSSWQKFNCEVGLHPTQKPLELMRYMGRTYTNPGGVVLDPSTDKPVVTWPRQNSLHRQTTHNTKTMNLPRNHEQTELSHDRICNVTTSSDI